MLASINALSEDPSRELLKKLQSKESDVTRWTQLIEHQYRKEESREIDDKVNVVMAETEDTTRILANVEAKVLCE